MKNALSEADLTFPRHNRPATVVATHTVFFV